MNYDEPLQPRDDSLLRQAEKTLSFSPEEFQKMPDLQQLVRDLVRNTIDLETEIEQLRQGHEKLKELHKQSRELYDFAPVGYFNVDNRGVIVNVNFTACDMLGGSKDNLVNTPFIKLVEAQYYHAFRSYLKEITETGQRLSTEIEMTRQDGTTFHAQLQTVSLYEKSNIEYRVSVADITQRKRAEKAVAESEKRYRDLADLFPESIFETDDNGKVTYVNQKALAFFELSEDDLRRGTNILEYVTPEQKSMAFERFKAVLKGEDPGAQEYTLMKKGGIPFSFLVHTARIVREGNVRGVRGIALDITERKRLEKELNENKERLETTLDNMLEGCQIIRPDWRYAYVNTAVAEQGHRTRDELLGHTMMEMYPGIETTELFQHLRNCMENRTPHTMENEFAFPDGSKGWFELRIEPVPDGILILSMDITERKVAEERLKRGIERLEYIHGITEVAEMQPVGLLMIEHRLIERVIAFFAEEKAKMEQGGVPDRDLIEYMIDFFRTYTDKTHHGKEETVLFKALAEKHMIPEHRRIMDELIEEHKIARKLVGDLSSAEKRWTSGDTEARVQMIAALGELVKLYPSHIEKEDKHFFLPCMEYFNTQEQNSMLLEFWEFDRQMIHIKYTQVMEALKKQ